MIRHLIIIQAILQTVLGNCSVYQFESQPPLRLETCVPYNFISNPPHWRLRFMCEVENLSGRSFDVHWFKRGGDNIVEDLGRLTTNTDTQYEIGIIYGLHILNDPFDESMLGDYWCQPIDTSVEPNVYYGRSNIITILEPSEYDNNLPFCSEIPRNETVTCADETFNPFETSSSAFPSPTTKEMFSTNTVDVITSSSTSFLETLTSTFHSSSVSNRITPPNFKQTSGSSYSTRSPTSDMLTVTSVKSSIISTQTFSSANTTSMLTQPPSFPSSTISAKRQISITTSFPAYMSSSMVSNTLEDTVVTPSLIVHTSSRISVLMPSQSNIAQVPEAENHLIMAGSIGGVILLLITLLSIIVIFFLVCVTKKKKNIHSGKQSTTISVAPNPSYRLFSSLPTKPFTGSSETVNPNNGDYESLITSRMDKDGVYTSCDHKMRSKESPNFARVSKESIKDVNYQALVSVNTDYLDVYASIKYLDQPDDPTQPKQSEDDPEMADETNKTHASYDQLFDGPNYFHSQRSTSHTPRLLASLSTPSLPYSKTYSSDTSLEKYDKLQPKTSETEYAYAYSHMVKQRKQLKKQKRNDASLPHHQMELLCVVAMGPTNEMDPSLASMLEGESNTSNNGANKERTGALPHQYQSLDKTTIGSENGYTDLMKQLT